MPEVPPHERDPEEQPPSEPGSPPAGSSRVDLETARADIPFEPQNDGPANAVPSSYGMPPEPAASPDLRQPAEWMSPEPTADGLVKTSQDGHQASLGAGPFAGNQSVATTGVPHYSPPALPPGLAGGLEMGYGGGPFAEATVAAPPAQPRSMLRPLGRGIREVAETIVLALLIFLLVRAVVQNFQVEGRSMEPTLETGWYLLVNKAVYWEINLETVSKFLPFIDPGDDPTRYIFRGPKRGDVIVFKSPTQTRGSPERDFIKRVIAVPGETVEVRDCTVFINDEPLEEPYTKERPTYSMAATVVPPDHYFVLGDNRNNSSDSHSWGMLPEENIIGKAWLNYWPFSAFGFTNNTSVEPGSATEEVPPQGSPAGKPVGACP